ncbi:hypothetical protein VTK73DRAFT_7285 [Phialemonium thermophilum]|uniref:Fe2OG dioxygenase domain-containing protein n=1 Tax=Phialemonium thermophilum TaxID=223376 RepID=A0ABR3WFS1_9PEZI
MQVKIFLATLLAAMVAAAPQAINPDACAGNLVRRVPVPLDARDPTPQPPLLDPLLPWTGGLKVLDGSSLEEADQNTWISARYVLLTIPQQPLPQSSEWMLTRSPVLITGPRRRIDSCVKSLRAVYFTVALVGALLALFAGWRPQFDASTSVVGSWARRARPDVHTSTPSTDAEHQYQVQIFSRDPLVIYVKNFVSSDEIAYLLAIRYERVLHPPPIHPPSAPPYGIPGSGAKLTRVFAWRLGISEDKYEPSYVYGGHEKRVDPQTRVSESAFMDPHDPVVRRIARRAREFQGWRNRTTIIEPLLVQRYRVDGFYSYHFDWDETLRRGNRATTFMTYLEANCTGGGTNFPFLPQPADDRWCDVIECDEPGRDGYQGVIFKPVRGAAVFWENLHPNGTGHKGVYHAGLPVKTGTKVGLNIWSWDKAWVKPDEGGPTV